MEHIDRHSLRAGSREWYNIASPVRSSLDALLSGYDDLTVSVGQQGDSLATQKSESTRLWSCCDKQLVNWVDLDRILSDAGIVDPGSLIPETALSLEDDDDVGGGGNLTRSFLSTSGAGRSISPLRASRSRGRPTGRSQPVDIRTELESRPTHDELRETIAEVKQSITSLKSEQTQSISSSKSEIESLLQTKYCLAEDAKASTGELKREVESKIQGVESSLKQHGVRMEERLKGMADAAKADGQLQKERFDSVHRETANNANEIAELKGSVKNLSNQLSSVSKDVASLTDLVHGIQSSIRSLRHEVVEQRLPSLEAATDALDAGISGCRERIEKQHEAHEALSRRSREQAVETNQAIVEQLNPIHAALDKVADQVTAHGRSLTKLDTAIQSVQSELVTKCPVSSLNDLQSSTNDRLRAVETSVSTKLEQEAHCAFAESVHAQLDEKATHAEVDSKVALADRNIDRQKTVTDNLVAGLANDIKVIVRQLAETEDRVRQSADVVKEKADARHVAKQLDVLESRLVGMATEESVRTLVHKSKNEIAARIDVLREDFEELSTQRIGGLEASLQDWQDRGIHRQEVEALLRQRAADFRTSLDVLRGDIPKMARDAAIAVHAPVREALEENRTMISRLTAEVDSIDDAKRQFVTQSLLQERLGEMLSIGHFNNAMESQTEQLNKLLERKAHAEDLVAVQDELESMREHVRDLNETTRQSVEAHDVEMRIRTLTDSVSRMDSALEAKADKKNLQETIDELVTCHSRLVDVVQTKVDANFVRNHMVDKPDRREVAEAISAKVDSNDFMREIVRLNKSKAERTEVEKALDSVVNKALFSEMLAKKTGFADLHRWVEYIHQELQRISRSKADEQDLSIVQRRLEGVIDRGTVNTMIDQRLQKLKDSFGFLQSGVRRIEERR